MERNGISGPQISNIFWGEMMPPDTRSDAPPLENLHPLQQIRSDPLLNVFNTSGVILLQMWI